MLIPSMEFHSLFLYIIILIPFISVGITSTHDSSNDLKALNGFSHCLESPILGWNISTSQDHCTWPGVTCDDDSKRVVSLELGSKVLAGNICESLSGLDQLKVLNLSHNFLSGSLPYNLFHLHNLEVVDLSDNHFYGSINKAICAISTRVQVLKLSGNLFSGNIPDSLGDCSSLQHLFIGGNNLTGSIPDSIFHLQNLSLLYMNGNNISGPLSKGFGNLSNLVELDISNNGFYGILPDIFGRLIRLKLHGKILTGGQFDTFPSTSFEGNKGLYCYDTSATMPSLPADNPAHSDPQNLQIIGPSFGFGAVVGFLITVGICFSSGWIFAQDERITLLMRKLKLLAL